LQLADMIEEGYLDRWRSELDTAKCPAPERLSRAVSAHLLDRGYAMGYLHRWARGLVRGGASLGDLFDAAQGLASATAQTFEVLVPFVSVPRSDELAAGLPSWRDARAAAAWLVAHGGAPQGVRQSGA